jgi:hypothetical protein
VVDILKKLRVQPVVDAFASADNRRFDGWWGDGSPFGVDAFELVVLITPVWPRRRWYQRLVKLTLARVEYPVGYGFFDRFGGERRRGVLWPVQAALVC